MGEGELRVGIDLGHPVLREALGVYGQEERGLSCDSPTEYSMSLRGFVFIPVYR